MNAPRVTVLVRCYQAERTLPLAVASVLAQTFEDLECLIVDDGSTDETSALVATFRDKRIRYVRLPTNRGRAAASERGIAEARGEYLALVDADDWLYPQKLAQQVPILQKHADFALISSGLVLVDQEGAALAVEGWQGFPTAPVLVPPLRSVRPPRVPYAPSLIRTSLAKMASFDLNLRRSEDLYFLLQLLLDRPSAILPEPLYVYTPPALDAYVDSARSARRIFAKYAENQPIASRTQQLRCIGKEIYYAGARCLGRGARKRGRALTDGERKAFQIAQSAVHTALRYL